MGEPVDVLDLDADELPAAPQPRPPRTRRRRRRLALGLGAGAAALVVLVGVARHLTGPAGDGEDGAAAGEPTAQPAAVALQVPAEELFPALVRGPAPGEDYPEAAVAAARDVVPGTARLLGRDGDLLFWVARDDAGSVCLLVRSGGEPLRLGGACAPLLDAAAHGVALPAGDGVSAVLTPATLDPEDAAAVAGPGHAEVAPSLWVQRAQAAAS